MCIRDRNVDRARQAVISILRRIPHIKPHGTGRNLLRRVSPRKALEQRLAQQLDKVAFLQTQQNAGCLHANRCISLAFDNQRFLTKGIASRQLSQWPVSYTHLDVYKRQLQRTHPFVECRGQ